LIHWIQASQPQGSVRNSVTVVFDGKDEFFGAHVSHSVKVIFSKGRQSADDLIKNIIEQSAVRKSWVVVSNDKDIKLYVRALGANVLSVSEFIRTGGKTREGSKSSRRPPADQDEAGKYISMTDQAKITKEFESIWIKPKGNPRQVERL